MERLLLWTGLVCRWLLAAVLLYAALPKLFQLSEFAGIIAAYGLLPEFFVYPAAGIITFLEIVAAIALLLNRKFAIHLTLLLLSMFIGVLVYGIMMDLDIDCGCFTLEDPESKAFSGLRVALIRDILLLIPLLYLYLQSGFKKKIL